MLDGLGVFACDRNVDVGALRQHSPVTPVGRSPPGTSPPTCRFGTVLPSELSFRAAFTPPRSPEVTPAISAMPLIDTSPARERNDAARRAEHP